MIKGKSRKRPCCICHKWFTPDVRQKGRQKACSKECQKEHHRRDCKRWNKRNKSYHQSNYLNTKVEQIKRTLKTECRTNAEPKQQSPQSNSNLSLPRDIFCNEIGVIQLILLEYMAKQISYEIPKWVNNILRRKHDP